MLQTAYDRIFKISYARHVNIQVRGYKYTSSNEGKFTKVPHKYQNTNTHTHAHTFLFIHNVYKTAYGFPNKTEDVLMLRILWQNLRICQSTINTIYLFIRHVRTVCCLWATRWLTLSCSKWQNINTVTFRGHQLFVYKSVFVATTSYISQHNRQQYWLRYVNHN